MSPDEDREMFAHLPEEAPPDPKTDWCYLKDVAKALGHSPHTASAKAKSGDFLHFEHGVPGCGRRKYSRALIERELWRRWEQAVRVQDELLSSGEA
jgi:hypothetical protein